jgi:hypothetical protein
MAQGRHMTAAERAAVGESIRSAIYVCELYSNQLQRGEREPMKVLDRTPAHKLLWTGSWVPGKKLSLDSKPFTALSIANDIDAADSSEKKYQAQNVLFVAIGCLEMLERGVWSKDFVENICRGHYPGGVQAAIKAVRAERKLIREHPAAAAEKQVEALFQ